VVLWNVHRHLLILELIGRTFGLILSVVGSEYTETFKFIDALLFVQEHIAEQLGEVEAAIDRF
jgi:hypothetical protein